MMIKVVIAVVLILIFLIYTLYFKNYLRVTKVFKTLKKFLDTRDSFVIKMVPEVKNQTVAKEIVDLVKDRKDQFQKGYNLAIQADVALNSYLKMFYQEFQKPSQNEMINEMMQRIKNLEMQLKKIREEYNHEVEQYNQTIVRHRWVCIKLIHMKPLDVYQNKSKQENV